MPNIHVHFHDEVKHDPKTGQFTSGGGSSGGATASRPSGGFGGGSSYGTSGPLKPKRISPAVYHVDLPGGKKGEMKRGRMGWATTVYHPNGKVAHRLSEGHSSMKAAHKRWFENYNAKEQEDYGPSGYKHQRV